MRLIPAVTVAAFAPACLAQFTNIADGRAVYGAVWFREYSTNQSVMASEERHAPTTGAWVDTVTEPLTSAVGSGTAMGHVDAEALTPSRIAGQASASVTLNMGTAAADGSASAFGKVLVQFDLTELTVVHVEATLSGEGAGVSICDANFPNYVLEEGGSGLGPVHISRSIVLPARSWLFTGAAGEGVHFYGQQGTANFAASGTFALTALCYANCDESTTAPVLNVADFVCFLNRFASGSSYANCDGSTQFPELNVADFTCFLNRFAAGCP